MAEVPIPFVDEDVDTENPSDGLMSIALLVVGFGVFAMASDIGGRLAQRVNSGIFATLGLEMDNGDSGSNGVDII